MKKILALFLCIMPLFCLGACSGYMKETEVANGVTFIKVTEQADDFEIFVHKETRVMYIVYSHSQSKSGMTVMLDKNGNPLLWNGVLPN